MLTDDQRQQFARDGYVVVPGVVDEELLAEADAEVDALLTRDPAPEGTTGPHFYFLPPQQLPASDAALRRSPALSSRYYRLAVDGHPERWADTFLDPFIEYPGLQPFASTDPFVPPPPMRPT